MRLTSCCPPRLSIISLSFVVATTIIVVSSSDSQQNRMTINKCCPQGTSLHPTTFDCHPSRHVWLYMNFTYGLPNCDFVLVNGNVGDFVSCIDNSAVTDSYIGLACKETIDPFRFRVPQVNYVRKCCTIDRYYDATQQSCYAERRLDQSRSLSDFFNVFMAGVRGIVDVQVGAPLCADKFVLVDYLARFGKVRREESESIAYFVGEKHSSTLYFNPNDVCLDLTERHEMVTIRACQPREVVCWPAGNSTCLRKCCLDGYGFTGNSTLTCVPSDRPLGTVRFYNMTSWHHNSETAPVELEPTNPAFYHYQCAERYLLNPAVEPGDVHYHGADGLLYMKGSDVGDGDYCVENVRDAYDFDGTHLEGLKVFKCFADYDADLKTQMIVNSYGMIVSIVFLILTLVVYSCLPSLRNLHGKILMLYVTCLLAAYSTHTVIVLGDAASDDEVTAALICKILGFTDHFAFLAAFFWLNVISFDIWWNFGAIRPKALRGAGRRTNDTKRLIAYNTVAWGMTGILTAVAVASQETDWFPEYARADLGIKFCWYEKRTYAHYFYFIIPTSISQAMNIVFFALTAHHCAKIRNELQRVAHSNSDESRFKADRRKFIMNLKLFIVMGVSWGLENISFWDLNDETHIFFLSDLANALQGVFIFGIFILKKRVLKAFARKVKEMLGLAKPRPHRPSTSSTVFTVSSGSAKLSSILVKKPPPLKKSCSDSRLTVGSLRTSSSSTSTGRHPQHRGHQRAFSSNSNNLLSVIHDYRSKPI